MLGFVSFKPQVHDNPRVQRWNFYASNQNTDLGGSMEDFRVCMACLRLILFSSKLGYFDFCGERTPWRRPSLVGVQ